jgi:hypothetical protein
MATRLGKVIADFTTNLSTKVSVGGTYATLQSVLDDDGEYLPAGQYYFTIDGDNSSKEHIIATLSTPSALISSINSVERQGYYDTTTYTSPNTPGAVREHRVGATVTITDYAHLKAHNDLLEGAVGFLSTSPIKYDGAITPVEDEEIVDKGYVDGLYDSCAQLLGDQTIDGIKTFSQLPVIPVLPLADTDACSKKYADDLAIAGSPDATLLVKGISEMATQAEITAGTQLGATGAQLFVNPKYLLDAGITAVGSVKTLIPRPMNVLDSTAGETAATAPAGNTTAFFGMINIPHKITVNKISISVAGHAGAGTYDIAIYSETGATRYIRETSGNVAGNGINTITLGASVDLNPGNYYVVYKFNGSANYNTYFYYSLSNDLDDGVAGASILEGSSVMEATAGELPSAIDPTAITAGVTKTLFIRLDN